MDLTIKDKSGKIADAQSRLPPEENLSQINAVDARSCKLESSGLS